MLTQPLPVACATSGRPGRFAPWSTVALVGAIILAHLPILATHASWLWARPHYQFFPFVLLGAAVLAVMRMRGVVLRSGDIRTAGVAITAAWLALVTAEVLDSSWLGYVAAMCAALATAYAVKGRILVVRLLPAWGMLWLLLPLPFDLDRVLIYQLQSWTTGWSSSILDGIGILHVRAGNTIEIGGQALLVEQACSGINSLFSVVACTLFFVLATKRGWGRGTILILAAIGWVLAANVTRVVLVALSESRWGVTIATGWRHEAIGLALFGVAVGLILSTDRLITFLFGPLPTKSSGEIPPVQTADASSPPMRTLALVAVPAYLSVTLLHVLLASNSRDLPLVASAPLVDEPELMPLKIGSWERMNHVVQNRDSHSYFGEQSQIWQYARGDMKVLVSIDSPFSSWHDLTWCYVETGWRIESQRVEKFNDLPGAFVLAHLSRPVQRHGVVLFCEFDRNGRPLAARLGGTAASSFRHKAALARFGIVEHVEADPHPPVYQLQVFAEGSAEFTQLKDEMILELFTGAREAIRTKWNLPAR